MTREELARIALRYDTQLSRAMLRALGIERAGTPSTGRTSSRVDRYEGARHLMHQGYGVRL